jgi:hypothetical protein
MENGGDVKKEHQKYMVSGEVSNIRLPNFLIIKFSPGTLMLLR